MWDYILTHECSCLQGDATDEDRRIMDERAAEFRQRAYKVPTYTAELQFNFIFFNYRWQPVGKARTCLTLQSKFSPVFKTVSISYEIKK